MKGAKSIENGQISGKGGTLEKMTSAIAERIYPLVRRNNKLKKEHQANILQNMHQTNNHTGASSLSGCSKITHINPNKSNKPKRNRKKIKQQENIKKRERKETKAV